ncbi:hypothetical protein AB6A40_011173 [Gnathostoma spinigerum]|uniref:Uncharacterized protein n=1 Tax=Gnathostoma spinigerum TaxID=75299 RepID=A0ABD6EWW9_9BILA
MNGNRMFITMTTNITTCGTHNGLIVHTGIIQGPSSQQPSQWFDEQYSPLLIKPSASVQQISSSFEPNSKFLQLPASSRLNTSTCAAEQSVTSSAVAEKADAVSSVFLIFLICLTN